MARRGRGDGSVFYDASRKCWVGLADLGRDPDTRRRVRRKVSARTAIPIARSLALELSRGVSAADERHLVTNSGLLLGASPWALERAFRAARVKVDGLPAGFRYHDLRHYFASLLIASGSDVKEVQARLRHATASTTLDTYGHLWPDRDESTRAAVEAVFVDRESVTSVVTGL